MHYPIAKHPANSCAYYYDVSFFHLLPKQIHKLASSLDQAAILLPLLSKGAARTTKIKIKKESLVIFNIIILSLPLFIGSPFWFCML